LTTGRRASWIIFVPARIDHIDIDSGSLDKLVQADVSLAGDCGAVLYRPATKA